MLHDYKMPGGALVVMPLQAEQISSLPSAPRFLMSDDERGCPLRGPFQRWFPEGSTLRTYERWMEVESKIKALDRARKDKRKPLVIMDWGTANGRFLAELPAALEQWQIRNVVLVGTSHQYYDSWQNLAQGIVILFGRTEHYVEYLRNSNLKIDAVLSHFALFELGLSQSKRKLTAHLQELAPFLAKDAQLILSGKIAKDGDGERTRSLFRDCGFDLKVRDSKYLKTQARPQVGGAKSVKSISLASPQPYQYNVITKRK